MVTNLTSIPQDADDRTAANVVLPPPKKKRGGASVDWETVADTNNAIRISRRSCELIWVIYAKIDGGKPFQLVMCKDSQFGKAVPADIKSALLQADSLDNRALYWSPPRGPFGRSRRCLAPSLVQN